MRIGWFVVWMACCLGWACSPRSAPDERGWAKFQKRQKSARQRQEANLSMLSMARSHHRRATLFLQRNEVSKGLHELDAVLEMPFGSSFVAGREALLDAWGRKASVLLQLGREDEADLVITKALAHYGKTRASFYLAQLYHIQGRILEKRKKIEAALSAYQRSIEINKEVIRRAHTSHLGSKLSRPAVSKPTSPRSQP